MSRSTFQQLSLEWPETETKRHPRKGRKAGGTKFAKLLGPVVWSAAELLTSGEIEQVKCCASETCGWLFLDKTKNHSRRGAIWPIAVATQRQSAITAKNYRLPCELKRATIRTEPGISDGRFRNMRRQKGSINKC